MSVADGDTVEVLLVEDNPADVGLTMRALQKNHLASSVHVVNDGAEALEFLFCTGAYARRSQRGGPRVVLLDLKLPKVDGIELLQRNKTDPTTQAIPVVGLTSSQEEADLTEN